MISDKIIKIWLIMSMLMLAPALIYAAEINDGEVVQVAGGNDIGGILDAFGGVLTKVIGTLFILVTVYFLWGITEYVMAGGDPEAIKKGREHMIWGIIGMAVMASAWGITTAVVGTFGVGGSESNIPSGPRQ